MKIIPVMPTVLSMFLLAASGCGSGGSGEPAATGVGIRVEPPTALVEPSGTIAFRATITGSATTTVAWSVDCGVITAAGLYTAPQSNGTCRVTATSVVGNVSSSALVNVGSGSWAARCAAEPEPTTNIVYACDCQPGADANCVAGSDSNPGTKAQPYQSWGKVQAAFRALPAGGTVAICKGGRWNATTDGFTVWQNFNCSPSAPCTLRDYLPSWGTTSTPAPVVVPVGSVNGITLHGGNSSLLNGGYRFLNIRFYRPDGGTVTGSTGVRGFDYVHDVEVCNCDFDGFEFGIYTSTIYMSDLSNLLYNWRFRGNRITNSCTDAFLGTLKNSEFDGNYFDNNGHALCGSYNLAVQTGGTTHTIYIGNSDGIRLANNEFRRNAVYQGYPQGQALGVGSVYSRNITYENNLMDWTPCHPTMPGVTFGGGNGLTTEQGLDGIVIRRNRIVHCSGRAMSIDSVVHGVIEDNTIVSSGQTDNGLIYVPQGRGAQQSSLVIRNNTIYMTGNGAGGYAIWATDSNSAPGNIITGNSVTFAGTPGAACFRVSSPSLVSLMDNNQCTGATNYATMDGNAFYSLADWRTATGFDANSIAPTLAGLFVNAPADLTPAVGSPLLGAGNSASTCTVLGVANQLCSSPMAIGSPIWSALDSGTSWAGTPNIGAFSR